jgi:hypothetical protein
LGRIFKGCSLSSNFPLFISQTTFQRLAQRKRNSLTKMSHSDKRCLWQVAEILGWSQTDLGRVRDFYCQPPILVAFAPYFEFRLADGLKRGYRASKVAALDFGALQGQDGKNYMGEIDEIEDPTIGDFDVWFTIRLIEVCRAQVSFFSRMSYRSMFWQCTNGSWNNVFLQVLTSLGIGRSLGT